MRARSSSVERQRIGPDRGKLGNGVALKLRSAALLQLGCIYQLGRHAGARDPRQDGTHLGLERLGILPAVEADYRVGETGARQRIEGEFGTQGVALRHESV